MGKDNLNYVSTYQAPGRFYFDIFADYFQFQLTDDETRSPIPDWNDQTLANRIVVFDTAVFITTARNTSVPVVVECMEGLPRRSTENLETWDHVVECSIRIPSGRVVILGNDYYPDAPRIVVTPGSFQVRIYLGGLQTVGENGLCGSDMHLIMMVPGPAIDLTLLKQAPPP